MHHTDLIALIAVGLTVAFIGGLVATRLKLPLIVGYLGAGVAIGPFTPGFVGDSDLATQLAEIGIILLMFGVGAHFSVGDLLSVRNVAIPGAVVQIVVATSLGIGAAALWGWSFGEGLVFGMCLSVASTVVLSRALIERNELGTDAGRIAIGWLVVEDLVTVMIIVLLPIFAVSLGGTNRLQGDSELLPQLGLTALKLTAFVVLVMVFGLRFLRTLLEWVQRTASRELFILSILAAALGIAYVAAVWFDASFALGAFLAGLVVGESDVSHEASEEIVPLREAFSVLFFVSIGMLIDPGFILDKPLQVWGVLAIIVVGKTLAAIGLVLLLRRPMRVALIIGASLAQIGEFSFILATLGQQLNLLSDEGRNLILISAILSISLNPFLFRGIVPLMKIVRRRWPRLAHYSIAAPASEATHA